MQIWEERTIGKDGKKEMNLRKWETLMIILEGECIGG